MPDANIHIEGIGQIEGIKSVGVLVPTANVVRSGVPPVLTPFKNCSLWSTQLGQNQFGDYVFVHAEPVGRVDADLTRLTFVYSGLITTYERDEYVKNCFWQITKQVSNNPAQPDSGVYDTASYSQSKEIGTGVWVNTTRSLFNDYGSSPYTLDTGLTDTQVHQTEEFGEIRTKYQYIRDPINNIHAPSTHLGALGLMIENEYTPVCTYFGLLKQSTIVSPPTRTDIDFDPETRDQIVITRTISTTQLTTQSPGTEVTSKQINEGLYLNITRTIGSPSGYTIYGHHPYEVPALLQGVTLYAVQRTDGIHVVVVNPIIRSYYNKQVQARVVVDYFDTPPAASMLFTIKPQDVVFRGAVWGIQAHHVLCDAATYSVSLGSDDPIFPSLTESLTVGATTPSVTAYTAAIGTYQLVFEETVPWRYAKYRRTRIYALIE